MQGHLQLHSKSRTSMGFRRPYLSENKEEGKERSRSKGGIKRTKRKREGRGGEHSGTEKKGKWGENAGGVAVNGDFTG